MIEGCSYRRALKGSGRIIEGKLGEAELAMIKKIEWRTLKGSVREGGRTSGC
jgi:hypothetical protein